ncbi:MAG: YciI family protein [Planctomycetota bacterium]
MQYAVLLYADSSLETGPEGTEWSASLPAHQAFGKRLEERGFESSGAPLHSVRTSTCLRIRDGEKLITDGPFAETKEQLWGFYLVEAPDLDAVLDVTADLWEAHHGTVEVRPCVPKPADA